MLPFKPNKKYTLFALYAAATVVLSILFGVLIFNLGSVGAWLKRLISSLSPLLYGLIIAYLTRPLVARFERLYKKLFCKAPNLSDAVRTHRENLAKASAIASSFLLLGAIVLCFSVFVLPLLLGDTKLLGERLVLFAEKVVLLANQFGPAFGFHLTVDSVLDFVQTFRDLIMQYATTFSTTIATALFDFFVGLCLSVGILFHRAALASSFKRLFAAICSLRVFRYIERLCFYSNRIFGKYLIGKIVECAIVGLIYLITLPILGIPYPILITLVMTVTNFIPIIGAIIGGIPCGILILTGENPLLALWFIVLVLIVEQLDGNIIFPKVIGSIIDLRAVWIMVAVALFGGFYGIVGMFLSAPIFSILYMIVKDATNHRLEKKGHPTVTEHYTDLFATTAAPRKRKLKHLFFLGDKEHEEEDSHENNGKED